MKRSPPPWAGANYAGNGNSAMQMRNARRVRLAAVCVWLLALTTFLFSLAIDANGASVGPSGYTNAFSSQPSISDWGTTLRSGSATDVYDMDSDVNANVTSSGFNSGSSSATDPPSAGSYAVWSSTGLYMQTRP